MLLDVSVKRRMLGRSLNCLHIILVYGITYPCRTTTSRLQALSIACLNFKQGQKQPDHRKNIIEARIVRHMFPINKKKNTPHKAFPLGGKNRIKHFNNLKFLT